MVLSLVLKLQAKVRILLGLNLLVDFMFFSENLLVLRLTLKSFLKTKGVQTLNYY